MTHPYGPHDEDNQNNTELEEALELKDNRIVHRKIFTVRPLTPTRQAIELVVVQRLNDQGQLTTPTLTRRGKVNTYVESWQFARDYGSQWIAASVYMLELIIQMKMHDKS